MERHDNESIMRFHNAGNFGNLTASLLTLYLLLWTVLIGQAQVTDSVKSSNPPNSLHYLIEGVYYLVDESQPEQALPYFRKSIELHPNHPDAYYFLGVSYYRLGKAINHALFYLFEAEKRGIEYDRFRPNLIPEIQELYPNVSPAAPQIKGGPRETQIIVEGKDEREGSVAVQSRDGVVQKFRPGEPIPLVGGKHHKIRFTDKPKRQFFKRLALVGSVIAVWLLR